MIGRTLQHYRIVGALGRGGMGEVYAAEDLRLHRTVALKILPPEMARDPERLQRFLREAQAVAALNHPNVVTLFGVEQADGIHFLTMELVEGSTLADLIPPKGFPPAQFLSIAVPLADAISAAHQRGIVHRDLKPANVMVGADGRPKVLDFGLAKFMRDDASVGELETVTAQELTAKHVMGTAPYMSPEQAQGQPVDARSDIFSLGVMFYEMATGVRPFSGTNPMSILSSIIKDSPAPPGEVNPASPRALDRIIGRCLAKDPARRYQSAADLCIDLEELKLQASSTAVEGERRPVRRNSRTRATVVAGGAIVASVVVALAWRTRNPAPVSIPTPRAEFSQLTSSPGVEWFPSLAPDGRWLVYAGSAAGSRHIYLQSVTGQNTLDLSGDSISDDDQPAFSPDGERIAFRSSRDGGGLFVMGRTGEAVRRVTRTGFRPTWSPDGAYLAFVTENVELNPQNAEGRSELWTVNVSTGETRRLIGEFDAVLPSWSPHNHRIAFTRRLDDRGIWTIPVTGGTPTPAVASDVVRNWSPIWSPDGKHLYFASDRAGSMNLWRVAIDEASGKVSGEPEPITTPAPYLAHPSVSGDGTRLVYSSALTTTNIQRLILDPATGAVRGEPSWVTTGSRVWSSPDPSPDGAWVAFYSLVQPEGDLYIARPDGTGLRQLTADAAKDRLPRWSPDGQWISTFSDRSDHLELWKIRPDGSDLRQVTGQGGSYHAWSPDGLRIAAVIGVESRGQVGVVDSTRLWKEQKVEELPPFNPPPARFRVNSWSPDGERLVGHADAGSIGIATYSLRPRTYERLTDFGVWPVWLPDSRRVLFVANGNAFFIVDARTKQVQKVFSVARDVLGPPRLTRDGTTAYFSRRVTESDIWLLTLK